jgi:hypothetical protein
MTESFFGDGRETAGKLGRNHVRNRRKHMRRLLFGFAMLVSVAWYDKYAKGEKAAATAAAPAAEAGAR